jgi:hypothetical protein
VEHAGYENSMILVFEVSNVLDLREIHTIAEPQSDALSTLGIVCSSLFPQRIENTQIQLKPACNTYYFVPVQYT